MANIPSKNQVRVIETRDVTYEKRSMFFGLIKWKEQICSTHIANDLLLILNTPIRKIMIDNNGVIQEVYLTK